MNHGLVAGPHWPPSKLRHIQTERAARGEHVVVEIMEVHDIAGRIQSCQVSFTVAKVVGEVRCWVAGLFGPEAGVSVDTVRIVLTSTHVIAPGRNSGLGLRDAVVDGRSHDP